MTPEIAELSRTIEAAELGRRIKIARIAAGLTQAQLAKDEVSTAYISRIEDGQRRPEAGLLERLTLRLGTTLEELLLGITVDQRRELELALDYAELSLASGDGRAALAGVDKVIADLADVQAPRLLRTARQVRAGALEMLGELDAAIVILEELAAEPEPDARWLKGLISLSRCYRDAGDFANAITVGEKAAAVIDELELNGLTEAIQLTVTVAAAYHFRGDAGQAMRLCMKALAAAEKYGSPIAQASAYWNASVIESTRNGATGEALVMAGKALQLFESGEDNRNLAKLRAEVANLHLQMDPPEAEAALAMLEQAETELSWSGASAWEISLLHLTRGRAQILLGRYDEADAAARLTLETAPEESPYLKASALVLQGQIAAAAGRLDEARDRYQSGVRILSGVGADRRAAQLWFELGDLLAEVGDTAGALDAVRRAAASTGLRSASRASVTTT